ncbi:MAG: ABC transporter permease, partial [Thermoanaerobaculia bacterium]
MILSGAVVAQFSLAFVLLATAGLFIRSLMKAGEANPGFRPEHVISIRIALPEAVYKTAAQTTSFFDRLFARLGALPGVRQTGAMSDLPMNSTANVVLSIEGRSGDTEKVDIIRCHGNPLDALRISLLRGRMPGPDDQLGTQPVAVISQALAERVWPHEDPIGRHLRFGIDVPNNDEPWLTVVGVVADVKARLTSNAPRPLLLATTTQKNWDNQMNVVVRTAGDPLLLASAIRHEIAGLDPSLPSGKIETLDQVLGESLSGERFRTWLLVSFASVALLLATLGIAGLL